MRQGAPCVAVVCVLIEACLAGAHALQSETVELKSFFNTLAVFRLFSVILATRTLVFHTIQSLGAILSLIVWLLVRRVGVERFECTGSR